MRSLITGVSGFAGSHLAELLLAEPGSAHEVWGCDLSNRRRPNQPSPLQRLVVDLRDAEAARRLVQQSLPEAVYHLAGQASVGDSWSQPWDTLETNLRSLVNLLEAILAAGLRPRVLVVGSADVYGRVPVERLPISETHPLQPDSPYGVSKVGQDMLGLQYFLSRGLTVVRVRPFNHLGPRQHPRFVAPSFASQIAAIESGRQPPVLRVGNLEARRDYTDVRDVVRAYRLALEQGEPGEVYNIGSGRSWRIRDLLDILLGMAAVPIRVEIDKERFRPVDLPDLVCDATKFRARTGWAPQIPLEQSLKDLLNYERALLAAVPAQSA